ncbi:Ig-like domain-containing protein [uncultured Pseudoteredinibacter sp.]|uniref:Ig-like domain-containing protein n=1 Tax=uncultured Pseudoteredinibacter sp. TaxID=1641701 RepID=UPI002617C11B|nr:Ig-like domain-containing protein [uncultured Pseudoteredinibacter sp.]
MANITNISDNYGSIQGQISQGSVTDDKSLQLNGTAQAGQKINVYKDGQLLGTTTANNNGVWKFVTNGMNEGDASFTVTTINSNGVESSQSNSFDVIIDRSVSVTSNVNLSSNNQSLSSGQSIDNGKVQLQGNAEANATVEIIDGNNVIATVTANENGNWSVELDLSSGDHEISTKVTDIAGNTSAIENIATLEVLASQQAQTAANSRAFNPANNVPEVVLPPGTRIVDDGFRNDSTPIIQGTTEPGAEVTMTVQGQTYGPVTADSNGVWTIPVTVPLPEGESIFAAKASNNAGDAYIGYRIIIDTEAPDSPVIVDAEDNVGMIQDDLQHKDHTDDDTPRLRGTGEIGSTIAIYNAGQFFGFSKVLDDGNGNGVWSYNPTVALLEGEHTFTAYSIDMAGNLSQESNKFEITVDRSVEAPEITHLTDNVGATKGKVNHQEETDDVNPTIVGTAEAFAKVTVWVDGKKIGETTANKKGKWSIETTNDLKEGSHNIKASQTDIAGNESGKSDKFQFDVVLNTAPTAVDDSFNVTGPSNLNVLKNDSDPDGDPLTISKIESGPSYGTVTITSAGNLLYTPDINLSYAVNDQITYSISDGRGGTSTATVNLAVTPQLPTPTIDLAASSDSGWYSWDNITNDTTPTLQGTARANSTISLFRDGAKIADVRVDGNGRWEFDVPYTYHGTHKFHVTSNGFGLSRKSSNLSVDIDTYVDGYYTPAAPGTGYGVLTLNNWGIPITANETVRYHLTGSDDVKGTLYGNGGVTSGYDLSPNQAWGTFAYVYVNLEDRAGNQYNGVMPIRYGTAPPPPPRHYDPIAALEDGGYIVSFALQSNIEGNGFDIYAQRYDSNGAEVGSAFAVNQELVGDQTHSDVIGLDDGGFVLTWQSENQDGDKLGIYARKYNAEGIAVSDEILINDFTNNNQSLAEITAIEGGGFAITWMSDGQDGSGLGIFMKIYDDQGNAITSDIQVADSSFSHQANPSISSLNNGNIVVAWQDHNNGEAGAIKAAIYSSKGELIQGNLDVSSSASAQQWPYVSTLNDGGFAVSWHENNEHGESAVMIQSFDENGTALNDEASFIANATAGEQAEIAGLEDGNILVSWVSDDDDNTGVYYSIVSPSGEVLVEQTLVNQNQAGQQVESHTLSLKDGGYLITWVEVNEDGELLGVHGQQFNADGSLSGDNFVVTTATVDKNVTSENNLVAEMSDETIPSLAEGSNDFEQVDFNEPSEEALLTNQEGFLLFDDLLSVGATNFELGTELNEQDSLWNDSSMGSYIDLGNLQLSLAEMSPLQDAHDINHMI